MRVVPASLLQRRKRNSAGNGGCRTIALREGKVLYDARAKAA